MKYLFIEYPKCSTCKKAKKWLEDNPNFVRDEQNVPSINKWPDSSWLKYFDRYCFLNNKYFVYPYIKVNFITLIYVIV